MLPEIKKILYVTDLSKNSAYAFRYAISYADKYDSEIYIIHIIEEMGPTARSLIDSFVGEEHHQKIIKESIDRIKKRLEIFYAKHQDEFPNSPMKVKSTEVYEGYPADEILKKAKELKCDMIVMGSHGRETRAYALLGAVSKMIVGLSRIPVCVIPLPEEEIDITVHDI
jgi:nucleotide-binding universal stress UspA family protein